MARPVRVDQRGVPARLPREVGGPRAHRSRADDDEVRHRVNVIVAAAALSTALRVNGSGSVSPLTQVWIMSP